MLASIIEDQAKSGRERKRQGEGKRVIDLQPAWEWMDSYATFIVAFLTIANLAATVGDSTNEWRGLRNRADYEPI